MPLFIHSPFITSYGEKAARSLTIYQTKGVAVAMVGAPATCSFQSHELF